MESTQDCQQSRTDSADRLEFLPLETQTDSDSLLLVCYFWMVFLPLSLCRREALGLEGRERN